jgi:hypothetical protein
VANQWIECPLVKVFAQDTASGTECDALNIGLIL